MMRVKLAVAHLRDLKHFNSPRATEAVGVPHSGQAPYRRAELFNGGANRETTREVNGKGGVETASKPNVTRGLHGVVFAEHRKGIGPGSATRGDSIPVGEAALVSLIKNGVTCDDDHIREAVKHGHGGPLDIPVQGVLDELGKPERED